MVIGKLFKFSIFKSKGFNNDYVPKMQFKNDLIGTSNSSEVNDVITLTKQEMRLLNKLLPKALDDLPPPSTQFIV